MVGWSVVEAMGEGRLVGDGQVTSIVEKCKRDDGGFCTCHMPHAGNCLQTAFSLQRLGVIQRMGIAVALKLHGSLLEIVGNMNVFKTLYVHSEVLPTV